MVLAVLIVMSRASVIDVRIHCPIDEVFVLLLCGDARLTHAAFHKSSEGKFILSTHSALIGIQFFLCFLEELLAYDGLMSTGIPLAGAARVFNDSHIEVISQDELDVAEGQRFATLGCEFYFILEPSK